MPFASPEEARANWLRGLAEQEVPLSREILAAYGRTRAELGTAFQRLQRELDQQAANGPLPAREVRKAASWRAFLDDIRGEFRTLEPEVHRVTREALAGAVNAGAAKALELTLGVARPDAALTIAAGWNRPDPRALRAMAADLTRQVRERIGVGGFAEAASQKVSDLLLAGMAAGYNPTRTARIAAQAFNVPMVWALSHARTAQIYAYRRGSHEGYRANPKIVRGWVWLAACDRRTCPGCFSMHGTRHGHDEELNDHHQGRCCPMPDVAGLSAFQQVESGEERFMQLSADDQRYVMKPRRYAAWQAGRVDFSRMNATYSDPVYGTMRRAATLQEMALGPRGVHVRQLFTGGAQTDEVIQRVLEAIGKVHRVEFTGPKITIETADLMALYGVNADGVYHRGKLLIDQLNTRDIDKYWTLSHEIGHVVDHRVLGTGQRWGTDGRIEANHPLYGWYSAVEQSAAWRRLQRESINPALHSYDVDEIKYNLEVRELWARSYQQYIANSVASPLLIQRIDAIRSSPGWGNDTYWDEADFAAIRAEIDSLFRGRGLR